MILKIDEVFNDVDVLLLPVQPDVAPRHGHSLFAPFNFAMAAWANILGLPATTVPVGLSKNGLPRAVQIVGTHGSDHTTIAIAKILQRSDPSLLPRPNMSWV